MSQPINPKAVLAQLTLEEKIQLTAGMDIWRTFPIERLKVPYIKLTDGPIGARGGGDFNDSTPSTLYPSPSCLGSTWDRTLAFEMGKQIALDGIEKQCHVLLGPTINIQRDPRAGRFFESYSEDPILTGYLASSFVDGCQSTGVGATMKHFVGNEAETERNCSSSDVSVEALREVYLEPFRIIMAELKRSQSGNQSFNNQPSCVMTAYNRVNGISASEDEEMINSILRKEWGFEGLVMSDWFALHAHGIHQTDLEMPGPAVQRRVEKIVEKAKEDQSLQQSIDRCALKVLELVQKVHKLGYQNSVSDEHERSVPIEQVAPSIRQIGAEGAVLMKNDDNILPIQIKTGLKIACIGRPWKEAVQSGGGSANLTAQKVMEPLSTFQKAVKQTDVRINHHSGVAIHDFTHELNQTMKLQYFTGREIGKGELVAEDQVKNATLGMMSPKPKQISNNNFWIKGFLDLDSFKTDKHLRFGLQAFGHLKVYVTINGERNTVWEYEGSDDFFETILIPNHSWQERILSVSANQKVQMELHYLPFLTGREVGPDQKVGSLKVGMEEMQDEKELIKQAIEVSKQSDVVIILTAVGKDWESEGFDRKSLQLPRSQNEMVHEIAKECKGKTIVLNISGGVIDLPWLNDISALVQCWYGGQEGAESLTDIILGRGQAPASGRLAHVWPKSIQDHSSGKDELHFPGKRFSNDPEGPHVEYVEGRLVGYRYYNKNVNANQPAFHFGEGIGGYTTFSTSFANQNEVHVNQKDDLPIQLTVLSKNTGKRTGKEIAQIYVRPKVPVTKASDEPLQRLTTFAVLRPEPGSETTVQIELHQEAFSHWDEKNKSWQVNQGEYEIVLARSARYGDDLDKVNVKITNSWSWTGLGV